jgi:hypothetical protein
MATPVIPHSTAAASRLSVEVAELYPPQGQWLQTVLGLELGSQRGTTPPRPAPAIGLWWGLEQGSQGALEPGHEACRAHRRCQLALGVDGEAQLAGAIEAHKTVDTGARAAQACGDVGRMAASGTEQEHVSCEEIAITNSSKCSAPLVLLLLMEVEDSHVRHSGAPGYVDVGEYPTYHTRASLCQSHAL